MRKNRTLLLGIVTAFMMVTLNCGCASLITFFGLSAVNKASSATTTSTSSGSTTTVTFVPGSNSISGTVSGTEFGSLFVLATVSSNFSGSLATSETIYVSTGETTKNYTLNGLGNGTYYVVSILKLNQWTSNISSPEVGNKVGQFSNGYVPATYGQSPSGNPEPIVISSSSATGKNFSLGVTWK